MSLRPRLERLALRVYTWLPRPLRRIAVRIGAPSFFVGSVGVVVVDGEVLLVRQTYRNGWALPGGLLDRGEEPAHAVVREIREEAGLAVVALGPPSVVVDPDARRVDVTFRCEVAPGADPATARATSPEIEEVRWVPWADLRELQVEAVRALQVLGYDVPDEAGISQPPRRTRP